MSQDNGLSEKLRRLVETVDAASLLTEPLTSSIHELLKVSAMEVGAREASVLVRDGTTGDLRFLAATGAAAPQLMKMKVPAGKGIAGFVISSGQPMAVADVDEEASFYAEVDKATGFSTEMLLATPLSYHGEVIGVLEYVNRPGEPPHQPFTPEEMDKAALFGEAIASLVNAYESAKIFRELGEKVVGGSDEDFELDSIREWLEGVRSSAEHREMMDLAILIREVASRGENERALCREILGSVLKYSKSRDETNYLGL
ncbi:MAG TPA: GAF domain-containing protein [Pyrinomonadaceae bacterium]|nr:GAF domain-containing protein [Pyrinomonadaceae bacterium]